MAEAYQLLPQPTTAVRSPPDTPKGGWDPPVRIDCKPQAAASTQVPSGKIHAVMHVWLLFIPNAVHIKRHIYINIKDTVLHTTS